MTGSPVAIAVATAANAACAGFAPARQLSQRSGHSIQQPECRSYSAGMRNLSRAGVEFKVRKVILLARNASIAPPCIGVDQNV